MEFLFFFGVVVAIAVGICSGYLRAKDRTRSLMPKSAPDKVNLYEVAYMRGGENELTRVIIVSLVEQGYLEIQAGVQEGGGRIALGEIGDQAEKRISQTHTPPPSGALSPTEQAVYEWFTEARTVKDVFEGHLPSELAGYCLPLEEKLQQEQFLGTDEDSGVRWTAGWVGGLIIGSVGGLRLFVGLERDEPVGFLVLMLIAGIGLLASVCRAGRLSSLGKAYLQQLQDPSAQLTASNGTQYALAAAVFGMAGLENTPLSALGDEFKQGEKSASGGCGGCGGGGCSDGGCGGCGGCG